jgi:hypothetical protein
MRYSDLAWPPIRVLASLWSKDRGVLPERSLWVLLWRGFWAGEFESEGGTFWGHFDTADLNLDNLVSLCLVDEPIGTTRAWLFHLFWQSKQLGFEPEQEPTLLSSDEGEQAQPRAGSNADYRRMAQVTASWRWLSDAAEADSRARYLEQLGRSALEIVVHGAIIERSAVAPWCKKHGWPTPDFLANIDTEQQSVPIVVHPDLFRTGAAGRPSGMHLIRREMNRRFDEGEWGEQTKIGRASRELEEWLSQNYPDAPRTTAKIIEQSIREEFNELVPRSRTRSKS